MNFPRAAGILLHPTSLPGGCGIGDFGPQAYRWIEWLAKAGMKIWQVLPLSPTGYGDSPYQAFSAFAGNPLLISLEVLAEQNLLSKQDLSNLLSFPEERVDFAKVVPAKFQLLRKAASAFRRHHFSSSEFATFYQQHAYWLDDYAVFMSLKGAHNERAWTEWEPEFAHRDSHAIERFRRDHSEEVETWKIWQYFFFDQWNALRRSCTQHGIRVMGDIPIYVSHDSADVWTHPDHFNLRADGTPEKVAGVPPDYFSATGQLWGNPVYRWDRLREENYSWWVERMRATLVMYDMVRLDHFRGYEAFWEVSADDKTAQHGQWKKGPGAELFNVLSRELGELPIVAENLGVITPEVEAIREQFKFPGMAVLQFAFSTDPQAPTFRPHRYIHNLVAYTGGHDNDTMRGWLTSGVAHSTRSEAEVEKEYADARHYFGISEEQFAHDVNWIYIREVMRSVANTVLFPMQDVLGLGSEARMNAPGTLGGNWQWRMSPGALTESDQQRLREFAELYER